MKSKYLFLVGSCLLLTLEGCGLLHAYRPPIQQGNVVRVDKLSQLKIGMTKDQVRYLLGDSVSPSPFDPNRWNYTEYYLPEHTSKPRLTHIVLWFEKGHLARATNNGKELLKPQSKSTAKSGK